MMRSVRQVEASRANGRQGRGPTSAEGRARSSRNATVHGLAAGELAALPHEDPAEIAAHVALWERELGDGSEAVREVVRHIAFLRWKLRRLDEVEDRRLHGEVLHRLDGTEEMGRLRTVEGAHCAVATMAEVMAAAVPQAREELDKLLVPVDSVLIMLEAVEDTGPKVFVGAKPLAEAVGTLRSESPRTTHAGAYAAVVERAVATLAELQRLLPEVRAALASAKVRIQSEMPLPGDRDAALRVRYRRDVERRLNAEMRFLMQVREHRVERGGVGFARAGR